MIDLSTLNENQLRAVKWEEGPLLVLAGPGSGKTRVLTFRIAQLIETSPGKHFRVLGLTFTNKAAAEMRQRIDDLVPNAGERTQLTTFHSFSADLLRQHGHHIGLKPDFTILAQEADRHSLLDEVIDQSKAVQSDQTSERLLPLITRMIENDVPPEEGLRVLQRGSFADPESLAAVYLRYRELMIERNSLDFAGLIAEAVELLKKKTALRKQIQRIYPHICVDEFQDTNLSQYKILRHLVNPTSKNLFVVADDDQIIYQWNGASPERLGKLRDDFGMKLLQLPENYRCPPPVVELANNLISRNFDRIGEKSTLKAHKESTTSAVVRLEKFDDFHEEADWVASDIADRPSSARAKCAVLARTKKLLEQIVEALSQQGVSGYLAARKNEFESFSLQWLHSIFRLANARNSREHLRRVCKSFFMLEGIDLNVQDIVSHASAEDSDYLRSWAAAVLSRSEISSSARILLETSLLPVLVDRLDFWQFQDDAFDWLDALPDVVPDIDGVFDEYDEEKSTWYQLVNEISAQYGRQEVTLHLMLQEFDLRSKSLEPPKGAIPCFTIHAAKGMEFDHVYLVGMVEDQLPSWAAIKKGDNSREMLEERRNCFVAITRAQETLTLTYAGNLHGWPKRPSRFLREMRMRELDLASSHC